MIEWIGCHRVGISSRTMWCAIMGVKCHEADTPRDADDFSRCYDLYKFSELTPADLQKVATDTHIGDQSLTNGTSFAKCMPQKITAE